MAKKFDWKRFLKISIGIFFSVVGATIAGTSQGQLSQLLIGCVLFAVGFTLLLLEFW